VVRASLAGMLVFLGWFAEGRVHAKRPQVLIDAGDRARPPPRTGGRIRGEFGLGASFGLRVEDPVAALYPALTLDFEQIAPIRVRLGAPVRLRLWDRPPRQDSVVRKLDWDEVGDYVSILEQLDYRDELVFGTSSYVTIDARVGRLERAQLGHGSLLRGYVNGLDLDRRRSGFDGFVRVGGDLLEQRAGVELSAIAGDLAGGQVFAARAAADWAGAALGFSVAGDPLAPRRLATDDAQASSFTLDSANRPIHVGPRGVLAYGLDLSYRASDEFRYLVVPYVDLSLFPGIGQGLHLGMDAEVAVGSRRDHRIAVGAELTVGSSGYDPVYFDVFYTSQRWQVPFVALAGERPSDLGSIVRPKAGFVRDTDLSGVGGYGGVRYRYREMVFADSAYRYRPGFLGHTWENRVGIDAQLLQLSLLYAHRGRLGFDVTELAGTLAGVQLRVPASQWTDVEAGGGWSFAVQHTTSRAPEGRSGVGVVAGAPWFHVGLAGKIPW